MTTRENSYGIFVALPPPGDSPAEAVLAGEIASPPIPFPTKGRCTDLYVDSKRSSPFPGGRAAGEIAPLAELIRRHAPPERSFEIEAAGEETGPLCNQAVLFRDAGFNRICLAAPVGGSALLVRSIDAARCAGIDRIAVEHPFARVGESAADERERLAAAVEAGAEHISLVERADRTVGEEEWLRRYRATSDFLRRRGFLRYEIAHFSLPGRESAHVLRVFRCGTVVGFGPGAVSRKGRLRVRRPADDVASTPFTRKEAGETISAEEKAWEEFSLGIRLAEGVDIGTITAHPGRSFRDALIGAVEALAASGWLERVGDRVRLSRKGIPLADKIAADMLP